MDNTADLRVLLASRYPLLLVETNEEPRFLATLRRAAREIDVPVWTWSAATGLARDGSTPQYQTTDPHRALGFVSEISSPGAFVFTDANAILDDPVVVRWIKEIAQKPRSRQTIILLAAHPKLPVELEGVAHRWALQPPGRKELIALLRRTARDLSDRGYLVTLTSKDMEQAAEALLGLTLGEAERLVQRQVLQDGKLGPDELPSLRSGKAEILNQDGILELVESSVGTFDEVGGLDGLKSWLRIRRLAMAAHNPRLDPPRGILLTGVPGCGKSLVAKTLARTWGLPLVLLDPSRLYGKYVGESEQRLQTSLTTITSLAPVVLWIDEIEKGFATGSEDSGVSRRILGTFLRWMQDRHDDVFVVATANQIDALPPELLRKGRFDEIFFVDLPDAEARREILEVHLAKRGIDPATLDVSKIAEQTDGFSGAEIETAVVGALYRAVAVEQPLTTERVLGEIAGTIPLSAARPEEIGALRRWARTRAVIA